jgi:acyl-CoA synthetase (AMP-forming)/AMP-acid ligase II
MDRELLRQAAASYADWVAVDGVGCADATALRAHELFGGALFRGYGQTEACFATMMPAAEWFGDFAGSQPLRSARRAMPLATISIIDEHGNALPAGGTGDFALRSVAQLREYWEDPEATAARIADGGVRTIIDQVDANGLVHVTDRKDDMIISGGFNIWPREFEQAIEKLAGVLQLALTADGITEASAAAPGSYKKPGQVELAAATQPKTPLGTTDRKRLREAHWAHIDRRVAGN